MCSLKRHHSQSSLDESKSKRKCRCSSVEKDKTHAQTEKFKDIPSISFVSSATCCAVSHKQIYELLKYAALGRCNGATQPSWCRIHHQKYLSSTVVIVLHGINQLHFYRFYLQFRHLRKAFRHRLSLLPSPSSDIITTILGENYISISRKTTRSGEQNTDIQACSSATVANESSDSPGTTIISNSDPIVQKYGAEKQGLTSYLVSEEEMKQYKYPLTDCPGFEDFIHTGCTGPVTDNSPLFGLDCEMCLTENGSELARISVVDAGGCCVMDELVKPKARIINYLTRFSGITRKMLRHVKTRLKDVQDRLKQLLPTDAVLVGHSLENDLRALQMIHHNIIDTSLLYPRELGQKFKLKFLAQAVLGKVIQCRKEVGHDPSEDARAALQLAQFFISQGPWKVAELNLEDTVQRQVMNGRRPTLLAKSHHQGPLIVQEGSSLQQNIIAPMNKTEVLNGSDLIFDNLQDAVGSAGKATVFVGRKEHFTEMKQVTFRRSVQCTSDQEVLKTAKQEVPSAAFSVVQFSAFSESSTLSIDNEIACHLNEMCVVYVGPFREDFCLASVKKIVKACGPIESVSIIPNTEKLHVCVQYEVLEGAELAIEVLNGLEVEGVPIKVQRPVKETTLDNENILLELEKDVVNKNAIYVTGIKKNSTENDVVKHFSHFGQLEAVIYPKDAKTGKYKKYCFIKYQNSESCENALQWCASPTGCGVLRKRMKKRRALTPGHLQAWINLTHYSTVGAASWDAEVKHTPVSIRTDESPHTTEKELKDLAKLVDKKVKKLYKSLPNETLCLVLLPGTESCQGFMPGMCLLGIKEDES
ncbi:RNA exonuclease 5 [Protopterus annectens]|uniref:RNA exonuclease 5 n=1 Tax=Protopterus annectens TaxID=7888 RepID=UPI001CFABD35|nr:RNA exonuclease 5 [Protopterus annectens]